MPATSTDISPYLKATQSLDIGAPSIVSTVARITAGATSDIERAVRIHDFVRDEVRFGWVPTFDAETASQTLASRVGFCNTKTPLFVALLRAAGIPARIHIVGIDKRILSKLVSPPEKFIDHSYAEVLLEGKWLKVDSFIVDGPLYRAAMDKLRASGKKIGYGLHINGVSTWNGRSDSFGQFVDDGTCEQLSDIDFGVHEDIPAFYRVGLARTPRNFIFRRVILRTLLFFANRKVQAVRNAASQGAIGV